MEDLVEEVQAIVLRFFLVTWGIGVKFVCRKRRTGSAIDDICKTSGQGDAYLHAGEEEEEEVLQLGCASGITFCSKKYVFTVRKPVSEICDSQLASGG